MSLPFSCDNDRAGAYVAGVLDPAAARGFEVHVSTCAACASRLRDEARLEPLLWALTARTPVPAPVLVLPVARPTRTRAGLTSLVSLAVAAAFALFLPSAVRTPSASHVMAGPRGSACWDIGDESDLQSLPRDQRTCLARETPVLHALALADLPSAAMDETGVSVAALAGVCPLD